MTNQEIGEMLKTARTNAKLTQQQVADKLNLVSRQNIQDYEKGRIGFTASFISRYCQAVGVNWSLIVNQKTAIENAQGI